MQVNLEEAIAQDDTAKDRVIIEQIYPPTLLVDSSRSAIFTSTGSVDVEVVTVLFSADITSRSRALN